MTNLNALAIASPGSRPLKNTRQERYCRLRASAQPRIPAYREAGWETSDDAAAYSNGCRLERRPEIKDRIAYLTRQEEDLIVEKRRRIEEALWSVHEADIGDLFETYDVIETDKDGRIQSDADGNIATQQKQRPKLLSDLPPEIRRNIEKITLDAKDRAVPQLYSKLAASQELRRMNNIGAKEREQADVSRLSDEELISTLAAQAKELGINIDLSYTFHKPKDERNS